MEMQTGMMEKEAEDKTLPMLRVQLCNPPKDT